MNSTQRGSWQHARTLSTAVQPTASSATSFKWRIGRHTCVWARAHWAVRGHATSYSAHMDSIVLSVTKNNISRKARENVWLWDIQWRCQQGSKNECYRFRYWNTIQPKTVSSSLQSSTSTGPAIFSTGHIWVLPDAPETFVALNNLHVQQLGPQLKTEHCRRDASHYKAAIDHICMCYRSHAYS